ncbi:hypothetical protein QTH90_30210 [Variovorax sp. J2P1-59]|uniref:hypothetical protein n=1 Tax=Variovorax flavidus TaxID=3053501 RepID=UPI002578361F|nr:hypothetical protein [Variovorax sp. J2P1-59]MDM0078715.1 hypothetical protein [Variovorax sp. J2P1-59]
MTRATESTLGDVPVGISIRLSLCALALVVISASAAEPAVRTEYAFRWNPAAGGPKSVEAAAELLGIRDAIPRDLEVRYLVVNQPWKMPSRAFQAMGRERKTEDGAESTYKLRGPYSQEAAAALAKWECPLTGPKIESKVEVDMNWAPRKGAGSTVEQTAAISASCTVAVPASVAFPPDFDVQPVPCVNGVHRLEAEGWKFEEWSLPNGSRLVEVSYSVDVDSKAARAEFQHAVSKLMVAGARPLPSSKTVLGSSCALSKMPQDFGP